MVNDDETNDRNCGIAFSSGKRRYVTKPKIYFEATHVRLPPGTKARIEAVRGDVRQADFIRNVLLERLDELEKDGAGKKAKKG